METQYIYLIVILALFAALALVAITAHLGLVRDAGLTAGESLFVHGGSGGVGSCVVQMAKALGARVITTAGSDEKAEICRRLGADEVVNYKTGDVAEAVRRFAPDGLDVWWETLREQDFELIVVLSGNASPETCQRLGLIPLGEITAGRELTLRHADGRLHVGGLEVVAEVRVDILVVVAVWQITQLPGEAFPAGIVPAGVTPAVPPPVPEGLHQPVEKG